MDLKWTKSKKWTKNGLIFDQKWTENGLKFDQKRIENELKMDFCPIFPCINFRDVSLKFLHDLSNIPFVND